MQIVKLLDEDSGNSAAVLVGLGFNCFEWVVQFDDGPRDLLWAEEGFASGKKRPSSSGIPLLFPFPGRIGHSRYRYAGREYTLDHDPSRHHALHGFVFDRPWKVIDQTDSRVVGEFYASEVDSTILEHWPSDFRVQASYELVDRELRFSAEFSNAGDADLPWGFGTHAYFRLPLSTGANVGDTLITVPVDREWVLEDMLPTGDLIEVPKDLTLAQGLRLSELEFDTPYRLNTTAGEVSTIVADPASGRRVTQKYHAGDFPHVVVYTPGHREAICVEPYTCVPDPFRLEAAGVDTGLRVLEPGEKFATQFVLRADG